MFLTEMERIRKQIKETEGKYKIVQSDLEETAKDFETTKTEYDRLEKELEKLGGRNPGKPEEGNNGKNPEKNSSWKTRYIFLKEQINSARQSDIQYRERQENLEKELESEEKKPEAAQEEKAELEEKIKTFQDSLEETQGAFKDAAMGNP